MRKNQLLLIETNKIDSTKIDSTKIDFDTKADFQLDAKTREMGRQGVAAARQALLAVQAKAA